MLSSGAITVDDKTTVFDYYYVAGSPDSLFGEATYTVFSRKHHCAEFRFGVYPQRILEKSRARERERGAVDNPDRSNVFVWLSTRIYDGHSLVEARVWGRERPLSPPDMSLILSALRLLLYLSLSLSRFISLPHPPPPLTLSFAPCRGAVRFRTANRNGLLP